MLQVAGRDAAPLAALLAERDILRGAPADLSLRLAALKGDHDGPGEVIPAARDRVRAEAKRLARGAPRSTDTFTPAQMAALAYPDRVGLRRAGEAPRYVLSGGKGAVLNAADPLAGQRLLVVTDTDGNPREARIRTALPLTEGELRAVHGRRIAWQDHCAWSRRAGRVIARQQDRFGALVLDDRRWPDAPPEAVTRAMLAGIREIGLQLSPAAERFRARVALLRARDGDLPDMGDAALLDGLEDWLLPNLAGVRSAEDWKRFDKLPALEAMLDWPQRARLDREVPATFTTPLGRKVPIDYGGAAPEIALRLQEMFGQTTHPQVAGRPLRVTLLSPAGRPVQTTMDLPRFWAESYADVRKDMRGQYPKHPWPEDPTRADPTLRTKRRG
jgi:ATP-dependent helicase HrpB